MLNRRNFLKVAGTATAGTALAAKIHALPLVHSQPVAPVAANDHIQIALIGAGGQGQYDTRVAVQVPGVKLVAVADCYDGRLARSKEVWGNDIFTTRDYRRDPGAQRHRRRHHWHAGPLAQASLGGRHEGGQGCLLREADDPSLRRRPGDDRGRALDESHLQVGSQRVSSDHLFEGEGTSGSGRIGQLNMVTAHWDRNSSMGAWNYTVPPDASPETCDWPRFLGTAPMIPFNAEHFFQWRKWKAYGSGVAGDLFVHLFSGTHFITQTNGPLAPWLPVACASGKTGETLLMCWLVSLITKKDSI